jgi:murein DD-endopeptidase MepM/ murein hydrolase activator NlpD
MPTVLAMLLLLSCSAMPGLASLRHGQTTTADVTVLASQSGLASQSAARRASTGAITPDQESTGSPTRPPLRLTVPMRPGAFAAGAATARTRASETARLGNDLPRSDHAVSLGGAGTGAPGARTRYRPPLAGLLSVLHRFEQPATPYAAGHRGVDLVVTSGQPVLAARSGRVQFAGPVAGRGVVVITHSDGIRTEYEPVSAVVHAGDTVQTGQVIGRVFGTHDTCRPASCLHWGARRGDLYIDPMLLLNPLGPVRLLPWTG